MGILHWLGALLRGGQGQPAAGGAPQAAAVAAASIPPRPAVPMTIPARAAAPGRPDRVDDVPGTQPGALCEFRVSGPAAAQEAAKLAGSTAVTVTWQSSTFAATVPTASAISGAAATVNAQPEADDVPVDPAAGDPLVIGAETPAAVSSDPDRTRIVTAPTTAAMAITTPAASAAR